MSSKPALVATVWRVVRRLLPCALVAAQGWLLDRLLRQRGRILLEQEQLEADLARLEHLARGLGGSIDRLGAGPSRPQAVNPSQANCPIVTSPAEAVRVSEYAHYHRLQDEARASIRAYPVDAFTGAGIVIVAGGAEHFTNAWVCLTVLRRVVGCRLPVQVWYLGPHEMSPRMIELLGRFDVECIDAHEVQRRHPMRIGGGWECKPYALVHSRFKEVILLDADNVPLIDPAALLDWPEYRSTGALFWPDLSSLRRENEIWDICRVAYRDEPEFETGQVAIDKERYWDALQLTLHLNEHSDFYYRYVNGDKETFHMAWRMLGRECSMPPKRPRWILGRVSQGDSDFADVLLQHDFAGREAFHHRTGTRWSAWGRNLHVPGFEHEAACLDALAELRGLWDGRVDLAPAVSAASAAEADLLRARHFIYRPLGSDERVLTLLPGGRIGDGRSRWEETWRVEEGHDGRALVVEGRTGVTCRLARDTDGVWRGRLLQREQVPVELAPIARGVADASPAADTP